MTVCAMFSAISATPTPPSRVAVLGCGLIGGSLARSLARQGVRVASYDVDPGVRRAAAGEGLRVSSSVAEACEGAELVVVAASQGAAAGVVSAALKVASDAVAVTDVSSVKGPLVQRLASSGCLDDARLVLGHPMAGSAGSGFGCSAADLFAGCTWVLTPSDASSADAVSLVAAMARAAGACRVVSASPEEHDRAVAAVSHLPQALSTLLAVCVSEVAVSSPDVLHVAGGGFRDMSRLAASPGALWLEILKGNREHVSWLLERVEGLSRDLRSSLVAGDGDAVLELFERANRLRAQLEAEG